MQRIDLRHLVAVAALSVSAATQVAVQKIELAPGDVGSTSSSTFSTLPTTDPALFTLSGSDVRRVNFDVDAAGDPIAANTLLTTEYASVGVLMNGIRVTASVFGGPASTPNATLFDQGHIFDFTVPVIACGVINTSPDHDFVELWSGPNGTGTLLLSFRDLEGQPINFNVDRFVGGRVTSGATIRSMRVFNAGGNLELDELLFEVADCPVPTAYGTGCSGANNVPLDLAVTGCAIGNNTISLDVTGGSGGQLCAFLVALQRGNTPILSGCSLLLAGPMATIDIVTLNGTGAGNGSFSQPLAIPLGLGAMQVNFQALALDPGTPVGLAFSAGQELFLF